MTANATTCMALSTSAPSCVACLMSKSTNTSWGALVAEDNTLVTLNIAGCLAITQNDSSAGSCAAHLEAANACEAAGCDAQCPVTNQTSFQEYSECIQTVDATGCATLVGAECTLSDAGPSAVCIDFASFQDGYNTYAKVFCGAQ